MIEMMPGRQPPSAPSPATKRQRRCRERLRQGARCMGGDVPPDVVWALVENGWLGPGEADDSRKLGAALVDLADCWMRGTLELPKS